MNSVNDAFPIHEYSEQRKNKMAITVLDGGMGSEIMQRLESAATGLWSATALRDTPELVVQIHKEYIEAGARIIITNTYSTIPSYLGKAGLADQYLVFTKMAGELAQAAVRESGERVQIAGSIPPLNESYRPDLALDPNEARPIYRKMVETLEPYVDFFLCETMSSIQESQNATSQALAHRNGKPVYVSWTLSDKAGTGLRSGESVTDAFNQVANEDLAGFMFNCSQPGSIDAALREIATLTDKPLGCYMNRFEVPDGWTLDNEININRITNPSTEHFVSDCLSSIEAGATIVGGCCGVGPQDIAALSKILEENGKQHS